MDMKKCLAVLGSVLVALVVVLLCVCCVFYSNARPLTARSGWSEWSQAVVPHSLSDFQNSERRREGGGHTYIITHSHGGQLTRAIKNLMLQQCWAWGLGTQASIVEPFSSKSHLLHTPALWDALRQGTMVDAARFSNYFDLEFYNHVSVAQRGVPLTIWEDFLTHAPRQAVVVATPMVSCEVLLRSGRTEMRQQRGRTERISMAEKSFNAFIEGLESLKFQVVKRVVINCSDPNRGQKLTEELSPFLSNATLVFSSWLNSHLVKTWLSVDSQCNVSEKYPAERLAPSSRIQEHMKSYRSNVLRANKTIAIMIRVERFLTLKSSGRSNETVDSCLRKTLAVYAGLKRQPQWADSEPYLTLDIGRFGSGIMQKQSTVSMFGASLKDVTKLVTNLLVKVYDGRWESIRQWEDSFLEATGGIHERGYVAMLQRGIAVQSDCLVLMGGGSYQEVAATQYLEAHPGPGQQCLHIVCAATALTTSLSTLGKKAALSHPMT